MYKQFSISCDTFELLPKWSIFCFYLNSVLITLWIISKWCFFFIWNVISKQWSSNNSRDFQGEYTFSKKNHHNPPLCLVGTNLGKQSYIKLKSIKFHYVESGSKTDPLILLLHGFPDCWISWRNQIKELSKFFRVIAIDLKGFNDSEKPLSRCAYKPKQICEEILQFINSLGLTSTILVGHDLGAIIGWMFVHMYPDHVEKFISVSAPHPNLVWDNLQAKSQINRQWLKFVQLPFIAEQEMIKNGPAFLEKCLTHLQANEKNVKSFYRTEDSDKLHLDIYKYIFNRKTDWTGPLHYYRNFPFYKIKEGNIIHCPCLIVTGNEDLICQLESIVKSTEYCSNFLLKIIIGAGHWPHQEKPDDFNKIILKFLIGTRIKTDLSDQNIHSKSNKSLMERVISAMTNSVKISGIVLNNDSIKSTNDIN